MPIFKSLHFGVKKLVFLTVGIILLFSCNNKGNNWPQFRGPNANQIADSKNLPVQWSNEENLAWFHEVQGRGWSSPIVWEEKVFFTNAVLEDPSILPPAKENERQENPDSAVYNFEVICLDLQTGEEAWKKVAYHGLPTYKTHRDNNYAPETMVTNGEHVYAYFGMTGVYCYDMEGNLVWQSDLGTYPMQAGWGTSTSPLLYNGTLYLQIDNEENSFLAAMDSKTGQEKWRIARDEKSNWGTPVIWENSVRTELVAPGVETRSYNPENGELYWVLNTGGGRNSASPTADGDMIFIGNEKRGSEGGILFGIKAGASGDISLNEGENSNEYVVWKKEDSGIAMASPLVYNGLLYLAQRNRGQLSCIEAATGTEVYTNRIDGAKAFWASPWAGDGKIYCLEDEGTTYVIQAGREFKVLEENKLEDIFWSTAAITNKAYIFRGQKGIYCVR
ncbi:MAG TPA: PQQ-binding-like beta-propeller repeat protein [Draconibacterium sp.]|nr:PQQ-binding-like beta-propeller repeat protein [Draconibacterium sp.]